jgi:hypothetical protein
MDGRTAKTPSIRGEGEGRRDRARRYAAARVRRLSRLAERKGKRISGRNQKRMLQRQLARAHEPFDG